MFIVTSVSVLTLASDLSDLCVGFPKSNLLWKSRLQKIIAKLNLRLCGRWFVGLLGVSRPISLHSAVPPLYLIPQLWMHAIFTGFEHEMSASDPFVNHSAHTRKEKIVTSFDCKWVPSRSSPLERYKKVFPGQLHCVAHSMAGLPTLKTTVS